MQQNQENSFILHDLDHKGHTSPTISYLQQEISHLNDKIADLEESVRLAKHSLKLSMDIYQKSINSDKEKTSHEIERSLRQIISNLEEENQQYNETLIKVQGQSDYYQSRALITEQIIEQSQKHRLELEADFEEKFRILQSLLLSKENKIKELEKRKPESEIDGVIIKYREILIPSQQLIIFQQEYNSLKAIVINSLKEINKLHNEKKEILAMNFSITNELNQLKVLATNSKTISLEAKESTSVNALIDMHKKFLDSSNSSNSSRKDDLSLGNPMNLNLNSPIMEKNAGLNHSINSGSNPNKLFIPKLDLTQAKKIQEYNAKRSTPQVNVNMDNKLAEKLQSHEKEIEKIKNLLAKEMCSCTLVQEENDKLKKEIQELKQKVRLFANSQRLIEENYQRVKSENNKLKDFYSCSSSKNKNFETSKSFSHGYNFNFHSNHYENNNNMTMDSACDPEKKTWKNYLREMDKQLHGMHSSNKRGGKLLHRKNSE